MTDWLDHAADRSYWRELVPGLTISDDPPEAAPALQVDDELRDQLRSDLLDEGWFRLAPCLPEADVARLSDAVQRLDAMGLPLGFLYVYDEPWRLNAWARPLLAALLGEDFKQLPDIWAWCIRADGISRGWPPHRDRDFETLLPNGLPRSLSLWIPLTDATPDNGCIYVLPTGYDQNFLARVTDVTVDKPQHVRALPARAGSILGWNHVLVHWSGRTSRHATVPRVSLSIEYQRADAKPENTPLLDPRRTPCFERRLGLIGKQIRQYSHMYDADADLLAMAERLSERFPFEDPPQNSVDE
jgi:hypothetical protein